jgi:hypothetical protein
MLANKRLGKVGGCLRVLPERLAGGEHGRWVLAPGGGDNGGGRLGWRAEERQGGFYMRLSASRVTKG